MGFWNHLNCCFVINYRGRRLVNYKRWRPRRGRQLNEVVAVWLRAEPEANLVICPANNGAYHLAYHLKLPAGFPLGDWEFLTDAHAGKLCSRPIF